MKIAIVTSGGAGRDGVHGTVPCLVWLIERLVRAGDEVHVFLLQQEPEPDSWTLRGATIHNAGRRRPKRDMLRQIADVHRAGRFDAIITLWSALAEGVAAFAGLRLGVPVLLYFGCGELAALPDVNFGCQLSFRDRTLLRFAMARADIIVGQCGRVVERIKARGYPAQRLPLGVAVDEWAPRAPRRRTPGAPARLLNVGHVTPVKDHRTLFEAVAGLKAEGIAFQLDCVGIDVAGDGAMARRAIELGLADEVRFHGFMPHGDVRRLFEAADLLVVSSRSEDGPLVVLEAAIAGVPTVGTDVGHLAEWAPAAARTVPAADAAALTDALREVLSDENLRLDLARRAQEKALAEDADATAEGFRALIRKAIAAKGR